MNYILLNSFFLQLIYYSIKRGLVRQKKDFESVITNILGNEGLSNFLMNAIAEKIYGEMREISN